MREMNESKFRQLRHPYSEYHSSGPYLHKNGQRRYIHLLKTGAPGECIQYGKYLLEVSLGRKLLTGYTVDHIDGNSLNDTIANLRELPFIDNAIKGTAPAKKHAQYCSKHIKRRCPVCLKWFDQLESKRKDSNGDISQVACCSRECARIRLSTIAAGGDVDKNAMIQHYEPVTVQPVSVMENFADWSDSYFAPSNCRTCRECGSTISTHKRWCDDCLVNIRQKWGIPDSVRLSEAVISVYKSKDETCDAVRRTYRAGKFNLSQASKELGISDKALCKRLNRYFGDTWKQELAMD